MMTALLAAPLIEPEMGLHDASSLATRITAALIEPYSPLPACAINTRIRLVIGQFDTWLVICYLYHDVSTSNK